MRGFIGLSLEEKVADHPTFYKNRLGRFKESGIHQEMFDAFVRQCVVYGGSPKESIRSSV